MAWQHSCYCTTLTYDMDAPPPPVLTNQWQSDGRHEDHDAAQQRHHEVAGSDDHADKRRGVLPLEAVDGGPVVTGPQGAQEDDGHHGQGSEHPHRVQKPGGGARGTEVGCQTLAGTSSTLWRHPVATHGSCRMTFPATQSVEHWTRIHSHHINAGDVRLKVWPQLGVGSQTRPNGIY